MTNFNIAQKQTVSDGTIKRVLDPQLYGLRDFGVSRQEIKRVMTTKSKPEYLGEDFEDATPEDTEKLKRSLKRAEKKIKIDVVAKTAIAVVAAIIVIVSVNKAFS